MPRAKWEQLPVGSLSAKVYHKAAFVDANGNVSPACAASPRAINLKKESWVLEWSRVTCPKCLKKKPAA